MNQPTSIRIYDFDHTIYDGDSTVDFYLFCLRKNPLLVRYLPYQLWHAVLFFLKLESRTSFKSRFFVFLNGIDDDELCVQKFWKARSGKIKAWYAAKDHAADVIISSSPGFLLQPITNVLGAHKLIATEIDIKTGLIDGQNCHGQEKVRRFQELFPDVTVDETYTDSMVDKPILDLAKKPYIVKGNNISEYKPTTY